MGDRIKEEIISGHKMDGLLLHVFSLIFILVVISVVLLKNLFDSP